MWILSFSILSAKYTETCNKYSCNWTKFYREGANKRQKRVRDDYVTLYFIAHAISWLFHPIQHIFFLIKFELFTFPQCAKSLKFLLSKRFQFIHFNWNIINSEKLCRFAQWQGGDFFLNWKCICIVKSTKYTSIHCSVDFVCSFHLFIFIHLLLYR